MSRAWAGGSTRRWRQLRAYVLQRDRHRCQIPKGTGICGEHATHVDHIVPLADGGPKWEPSNCRASCAPCNLSRGTQGTRAGPTVPVTVVIGPPAAGKTTAVVARARAADVVIDLDRIASALHIAPHAEHDYAQHIRHVAIGARAAAIRRAVTIDAKTNARVFLIHAIPQAAQLRQYLADGYDVEVIDPGADVVRSRAAQSTRGLRHFQAIDTWYAKRPQLLSTINDAHAPAWEW